MDDFPQSHKPDLIAEADQLIESHKQLARAVAAYHDNLVAAGCKPRLAQNLTGDYQHELFENGRGPE